MRWSRFGRLRDIGIRGRRGLAYFLLSIVVGFPLFYALVWAYGWLLYDNLWRVLGTGVNVNAAYSIDELPLANMDLTSGYLVFLVSISVLSFSTLFLTSATESSKQH